MERKNLCIKNNCNFFWTSRVVLARYSQSIICTFITVLAMLTVFLGSSFAGLSDEWTINSEISGSFANYYASKSLIKISVFKDKILIFRDPQASAEWTESIWLKVDGASMCFNKMRCGIDCTRQSNNCQFAIYGNSAIKLIQDFKKGTAVTIKYIDRPAEPALTIPLQGFNVAYERAMSGQVDQIIGD